MGEVSCPSAHKASPTPCVVLRIAGCELRSAPRLGASVSQLCLCSRVQWWAGTQGKRSRYDSDMGRTQLSRSL